MSANEYRVHGGFLVAVCNCLIILYCIGYMRSIAIQRTALD